MIRMFVVSILLKCKGTYISQVDCRRVFLIFYHYEVSTERPDDSLNNLITPTLHS
jgi:hypothetical protein